MIGGAKGIGLGIDLGLINQYNRTGSQSYIEPEVLDSLVGVWSAYGMTNDSPNRSTIKNKIPNAGGDFELLNFAYKLNSGYGKYEIDFDTWIKSHKITSTNSESFNFTTDNVWLLLYYKSDIGKDMPSFKVHIKLEGEGKVYYNYVNSEGVFVNDIITQEEYVTPISYNTKYTGETPVNCGFSIAFISDKVSGTITQIPSFQGALVTNGVDDLITSSKTVQEMLGGSNEITVVSMIHQIELNSTHGRGITNCIVATNSTTSFVRSQSNAAGKTGIYGYTYNSLTQLLINNILGDKNDYEKLLANASNVLSDSEFYVASSKASTNTFSKVAWYWTFIAKRVLTTDEINQVIAYYNLDKYVKPDIYYDVKKQGLSNNTPDADWYLKDFSGNGHDMTLYNFAQKLGSGIGKYEVDFNTWTPQSYVADSTYTSNKIHITNIKGGNAILYTKKGTNAMKVKITGIQSFNLVYRYIAENDVWEALEVDRDGIYELPASTTTTKTYYTGFTVPYYTGDCDITIEQIPNYEGALVFDAVDDYGQYVGDLELKDYTIAVDRAYPSFKANGVPIISSIDTSAPFIFEFSTESDRISPFSYGTPTVLMQNYPIDRKITYQSSYVYNSSSITKGSNKITGSGLTIGRYGVNAQYANIALWSLLLFPYTLSEFLLERQLKRYKLGSIYPSNSIVFRPYITSNLPYNVIEIRINNELVYYWINQDVRVDESGKYFPKGSTMNIRVKHDNTLKIPSKIKYNGKEYETSYYANGVYQVDVTLDKTPQKIEIQIDEYIRYEDIVQPYPCIVPIIDTNGKTYSWGDKIKVGTEIQGGIIGIAQANLLPDLYKVTGYFNFNGVSFAAGIKHVIGKTNVFELTNAPTYLKANEPNCIADPQRLRIPNSSYKILGYIPDISGHGNHLKINNSAYAGMSGANGYKYDWNTWSIVGGSNVERTDSLFTNKLAITTPTWGLLPPRNTVTDTFKIKVEGLKTGNIYWTYRESEETYKKFYIYNDGEYELPAPISESDGTGFIFNTGTNAGVIVRQIGQYEGSFCLDGVEDYLTIPTLSHGAKQVLMKVNWNSINTIAYDHRNGVGSNDRFAIYLSDINEAIAYNARNSGQTYIDGILNTNIIASQLKDITHNITITNNDVNASNSGILRIGSAYTNSLYTQMALFTFMSFPEISSEDEIKELNDIVGIEGGYVESPDYYWDAYGKSNKPYEDIDYGILGESVITRNRIFDKSVEGLKVIETGNVSDIVNRALTANNFAFSEESGYVDNGLVSDGVDDHLINTIIPAFTDFTVISKRKFLNTELKLNETFFMKGDNAYLGGVGNAFVMEYYYGTDPTSKQSQMLSFGLKNIVSREESDITWCTPTSYNNITINRGEGGDTVGLSIGKYSKVYWKGVFYKMMLYSKTIDMLSINMLKNLFAKDELIDVKHKIFKNEETD